ncbi:hypothetical protein C8Q78DRAFT_986026 [Trametes maxima]|nr:hypothetical protein C8Q78DRAFT_986026 [Trametes maxima]
MSSNIKLDDDSVRVPKLELGGSNWVLYKDWLLWAADAKGYQGHLDETVTGGTAAPAGGAAGTGGTLTAVAGAAAGGTPDPQAEAAHEVKLAEWRKGEANMKQLIASTIPDSLFMKIRTKPNAHAIWEALTQEFERKSCMVSVDLRRWLQEQRCSECEDVRMHFAKLCTMREDLSAMGHPPADDDFYAIITWWEWAMSGRYD